MGCRFLSQPSLSNISQDIRIFTGVRVVDGGIGDSFRPLLHQRLSVKLGKDERVRRFKQSSQQHTASIPTFHRKRTYLEVSRRNPFKHRVDEAIANAIPEEAMH